MSDREHLVCPACGRAEPADERTGCPDCGSDRAYLSPEPALPDATSEAYVKLDADEAAAGERADEAADGVEADGPADGVDADGCDDEGPSDGPGASERGG